MPVPDRQTDSAWDIQTDSVQDRRTDTVSECVGFNVPVDT